MMIVTEFMEGGSLDSFLKVLNSGSKSRETYRVRVLLLIMEKFRFANSPNGERAKRYAFACQ